LLACAATAAAERHHGFSVELLVDGRPQPVYTARGTRYVEALEGREYAIRLRNPLGVRVAVALSVDGLNTIDARRTTAADARKWVLGPFETVVISGWQTSEAHARRFYFTAEERSYASWLGQTRDMGVISAVFFRERLVLPAPTTAAPPAAGESRAAEDAGGPERHAEMEAQVGAAAPSARRQAEEYAATGIGRQTDHRVVQVALDLEPEPVSSLDLRYEYRPQLVRLGVLPREQPPLTRREGARGFEPRFAPVPPNHDR
jgi:hypothetical protein